MFNTFVANQVNHERYIKLLDLPGQVFKFADRMNILHN